jgi:similar to stage IV sporulation protein
MLILRLWNYIKGYVIIIVEGYFLEKFINICTHRQLRLWNVKWQKNSRVIMSISLSDFRLLRPVAKRTHCQVHIIKKKGLPFVLDRYKARKAFVIGAGICVVIFFVMSSFVWDVSVSGNSKISTQTIMDKLNDCGVKVGAFKYSVSPEAVVNKMMLDINELSRISVSLRGTKVRVEVNERTKPPDLIDRNEPCDLVALKEGVIYSIVTKQGLDKVKIGDTVTKGQLLVSGTIENLRDPKALPFLAHSMGIVKARTWYEASSKVEQKLAKEVRTGREKDNYSVVLFTKKIKLFQREIPYNNSEHTEVRKKLCIGENLALPFEFIVDKYYEYNIEYTDIDAETANKTASQKATELAKQQLPKAAEILKTNVSISEDEAGTRTAKAIIECVEDIGVTQKIGGN